jgi:hypothetical protein
VLKTTSPSASSFSYYRLTTTQRESMIATQLTPLVGKERKASTSIQPASKEQKAAAASNSVEIKPTHQLKHRDKKIDGHAEKGKLMVHQHFIQVLYSYNPWSHTGSRKEIL